MARNRRATARRLTVEQWTFTLCGNLLTRTHRDESDADGERRLFGTPAAAAAAWSQHRAELLAVDPVPGRRPYGWWRYERRGEVPPAMAQPALLASLGELSDIEAAQLEARRRMVPEPPTDLDLDNQSIAANLEEHHVDETTPLEAAGGSGTPAVLAGRGSQGPEDEAEPGLDGAESPADAATTTREVAAMTANRQPTTPVPNGTDVVENDLILLPWPLQNGRPREVEGWE